MYIGKTFHPFAIMRELPIIKLYNVHRGNDPLISHHAETSNHSVNYQSFRPSLSPSYLAFSTSLLTPVDPRAALLEGSGVLSTETDVPCEESLRENREGEKMGDKLELLDAETYRD